MNDAKKAGLYSKNGTFLQLLYVSPNLSTLTDNGKTYVLRAELYGTLRFHEIDPDEPIPTPAGTLSTSDVSFLKSMRITPTW